MNERGSKQPMYTIEFEQQQQNPDAVALFKAVGDYRRQLGYEETIRKLELMTEWTKELYVQEYDRALREQPLKGVSYLGRFISPHQMTDPLEWFKDQVRLFHRDQRLKKASRQRLERAGTEAPTQKRLADMGDTDEPGIEDWGPSRGNHQEGMSAELAILISPLGSRGKLHGKSRCGPGHKQSSVPRIDSAANGTLASW